MNSVRKGNDIRVCWAIYCAGQPYDLCGRNLRLVLTDRMGNARELDDYTTEGNVIRWTFEGRRQTTLGRYHLTLIENPGLPGMVTVDSVDFCELVPRAPLSHTGEEECSNLVVEAVTLQSDINLGAEEVLNEVGESVQRIVQEAASNVEAMGTLIVSATGQIEEEAERLHAVVSDARTATEQAKTFTNTATHAANIVTGSANSLTPIVEDLSGVARQTQTNCRNLAEVVVDLNSATFSARTATGNAQSAAASLSNLVGEWEQGKRQIVEALQAQGEEASVNDTFSALASKVVGIHKAVEGEEAAVTPAFFGSDSVDLLSVMHNHRRADMPYMCGARFGQQTITLSGADAYLCSDGYTENGYHEFTNPESEHWVIWYFESPDYIVPYMEAYELVALGGRPNVQSANAFKIENIEIYAGEPMTLEFPSATTITPSTSLSDFRLNKFALYNFVKLKNVKLEGHDCSELLFPDVEELQEAGITGRFNGVVYTPKLISVSSNGITNNTRKVNAIVRFYLYSLKTIGTLGLVGNYNASYAKCSFYFGRQENGVFNFDALLSSYRNVLVNNMPVISVLPGFRSELIMSYFVNIPAEQLRAIIENLADNNDYAPLRLTIGAANIAKLTAEDIALAQAKNYTVS